jgi:hypothetical protein
MFLQEHFSLPHFGVGYSRSVFLQEHFFVNGDNSDQELREVLL